VIIHERLHLLDELLFASPLCYLDVSPAGQRLAHHKEIARAIPFVGVVIPSDRSRSRRERVANLLMEFLVGLVKTDNWTKWVEWFVVEIENSFHFANERSAVFGFDHP
jgi:hypothetical protein